MTILILIVYMTYPFGGINDMLMTRSIVSCPAEASIKLWQHREINTIECRSFRGELYKIDLDKKTVIKIEIPAIKFKEQKVE